MVCQGLLKVLVVYGFKEYQKILADNCNAFLYRFDEAGSKFCKKSKACSRQAKRALTDGPN
jgi:hypothetical protein